MFDFHNYGVRVREFKCGVRHSANRNRPQPRLREVKGQDRIVTRRQRRREGLVPPTWVGFRWTPPPTTLGHNNVLLRQHTGRVRAGIARARPVRTVSSIVRAHYILYLLLLSLLLFVVVGVLGWRVPRTYLSCTHDARVMVCATLAFVRAG